MSKTQALAVRWPLFLLLAGFLPLRFVHASCQSLNTVQYDEFNAVAQINCPKSDAVAWASPKCSETIGVNNGFAEILKKSVSSSVTLIGEVGSGLIEAGTGSGMYLQYMSCAKTNNGAAETLKKNADSISNPIGIMAGSLQAHQQLLATAEQKKSQVAGSGIMSCQSATQALMTALAAQPPQPELVETARMQVSAASQNCAATAGLTISGESCSQVCGQAISELSEIVAEQNQMIAKLGSALSSANARKGDMLACQGTYAGASSNCLSEAKKLGGNEAEVPGEPAAGEQVAGEICVTPVTRIPGQDVLKAGPPTPLSQFGAYKKAMDCKYPGSRTSMQ